MCIRDRRHHRAVVQNRIDKGVAVHRAGDGAAQVHIAEVFILAVGRKVPDIAANLRGEALFIAVLVHKVARQLHIVDIAVLIAHHCLLRVGNDLVVDDIGFDAVGIVIVLIFLKHHARAAHIPFGHLVRAAEQKAVHCQSKAVALLGDKFFIQREKRGEYHGVLKIGHGARQLHFKGVVIRCRNTQLIHRQLARGNLGRVFHAQHFIQHPGIGAGHSRIRQAFPGKDEVVGRQRIAVRPFRVFPELECVRHAVFTHSAFCGKVRHQVIVCIQRIQAAHRGANQLHRKAVLCIDGIHRFRCHIFCKVHNNLSICFPAGRCTGSRGCRGAAAGGEHDGSHADSQNECTQFRCLFHISPLISSEFIHNAPQSACCL